jgi:hypothetical protein
MWTDGKRSAAAPAITGLAGGMISAPIEKGRLPDLVKHERQKARL